MAADVLVVDDDPDIRSTLAEVLREEGFSVGECASGVDLFDGLRTERPAVVLLDLTLPGEDIGEIASRLKRDRWLETTTFLAISGLMDAAEQSRRLGLHGAVSKPFELDQLVGLVRHVCARRRAERERLEEPPHASL